MIQLRRGSIVFPRFYSGHVHLRHGPQQDCHQFKHRKESGVYLFEATAEEIHISDAKTQKLG